MFIIVVNSISC